MSEWNHLICERCYISQRGEFAVGPDGPMLTGIQIPVQITGSHRTVGPCCFCGELTIMGIFVRRDPGEVNCEGDHSRWF